MTFGKKRMGYLKQVYFPLLFSLLISNVAATVVTISDSFVAGIMLSQEAVVAINVVQPLYRCASFLGAVFSMGLPIVYGRYMGQFEKNSADRVFGFGIFSALVLSVILPVLFHLIEIPYYKFSGLSGIALQYASEYGFWYKLVVFMTPVQLLLCVMVPSDGDDILCAAASIAQLVINLLVSVMLCKRIGIAGIGIGSLSGVFSSIIIYSFHFFKKSNSLRLNISVSVKDALDLLKYSISDASDYLLIALFAVFMNKAISVFFGERFLILASVIIMITDFQSLFDGIGDALTPVVSIYASEKNGDGVRAAYNISLRCTVIIGAILMCAGFVFAPAICTYLGITDPDILRIAITGVRIIGAAFIFPGLLYMYTGYLNAIGYIPLSLVILVMMKLVMVVIFSMILAPLLGPVGLFVGTGMAPAATWLITRLYISIRYGKNNYPYMLQEADCDNGIMFDFEVTTENIGKIESRTDLYLKESGVDKRLIIRTELPIEELFQMVIRNNDKKTYGQCSIMLTADGVQLITRDSGKILNIVEDDMQPKGLGDYVIAMYISRNKENIATVTTMSNNRYLFNVCFLIKNPDGKPA